MADDEPARRDAEGAELGVEFGQQRDVFFHGEPAYKAQDDGFAVAGGAGAAGWGEEVGVDAALHQVAGAVGGALQQGTERGWARRGLRPAIEVARRVERGGFDARSSAGPARPRWRESQRIRRAAYSCTLVCQLATSGTLSCRAK